MMTMIVADELAADSSKVKIERALAPIQSTKVRSSGVPDHRGGWKYVPAASHLLSPGYPQRRVGNRPHRCWLGFLSLLSLDHAGPRGDIRRIRLRGDQLEHAHRRC